MTPVVSPFPQYFDLSGAPLENGYLYFGQPNQNPETSPMTVYWDAAGTQPVAQPVRTRSGYVYQAGTPAQIYVPSAHSLTIKDRRGALVAYLPTSAVPA